MSRIFFSAAHKSSGKTTLTAGIAVALTRRNLHIQAFKKGPDYIDPMWLATATGHDCYNLDFHTMTHDEIRGTFARYARQADMSIIEGNKGLFDGLDINGSNSNAALANMLKAPVVLILDAVGMTRGVAPLILGYQTFDPDMSIAGVILNKIGGARHESKLRQIIEHYTDVPVIGSVHRQPALEISERHLGLIPSNEASQAKAMIDAIADVVTQEIELSCITDIGATAEIINDIPLAPRIKQPRDIRIAIARDSAFGFYYPDDLEALSAAGAELVFFDTLIDERLPDVDALLIGGGFPETHIRALEANTPLRRHIRDAIENGLPTYAECGGLMYLANSITWRGDKRNMVGIIPADAVMHDSPQGRGYMQLQETGLGLWSTNRESTDSPQPIAAHEFHYSSLENFTREPKYAYQVLRGDGIDGLHDGVVYKNMLAGFAHLRDMGQTNWTKQFVDFVRRCKTNGTFNKLAKHAPLEDRKEFSSASQISHVYLVGAGPGDPALLTVRARQLIDEADIIIYDRLVSNEILDTIPADTTRLFAGKASRNHAMKQDEINDLLVRLVRSGRRVLRLKGGDPLIFGRGSEEAGHLVRNGISFEIVPGITASTGCAARSGIPLTHRGVARSVTFVTGHRQAGQTLDLNWKSLADPDSTLVIYMGLENIKEISRGLIGAGLPGYTLAATIEKGTTPKQRTVITTLAELPDCVIAEKLQPPTLIIIGEVVKFADSLSWASAVVGCGVDIDNT